MLEKINVHRLTGAQKHEEEEEVHPVRDTNGGLHTCGSAGWWASSGGAAGTVGGPETRRSSLRPIREEPAVAVIKLSSCFIIRK